MARCFSCKKSFDYEKYYGICPKCGAYNRENTPQEEHRKLHEQWDTSSGPAAAHSGPDPRSAARYNTEKKHQAVSSPAGTIIFVLLIIGIVGTVVFPFFYFTGKPVSFGTSLPGGLEYEEIIPGAEETEEAMAATREPQTADIVEESVGKTCKLGKNSELKVIVEEAKVQVPAGYVNDFPEGEKLVGISVSYQAMYEEYGNYSALDTLYVGYGEHTYKECMTTYDMENYLSVLGNIGIVDRYNITYGQGEGEILVFVPEEITTINLYLESRNEDTYQLLEIYQIPLEIKPGEEI